jgi:hypothetical protein
MTDLLAVLKESDSRRDKKRREFAGKLGKEMIERRDEYVPYVIYLTARS